MMNPLFLRLTACGLAAGLGLLDAFWLQPVDGMLRQARSEIRPEAMPSWLDDLKRPDGPPAATAVSRAPEAMEGTADRAATQAGPGAGEAGAAKERPHIDRPRDAAEPDPAGIRRESPWARILRRFLPALFPSEYNRSFNAFTASPLQAAPTIENFNAAAVKNDPVLPHSGEMTFRHPVLHVPGVGYDFSFSLNYRSGIAYDGPVGKKWEHNWNVRFVWIDEDTIARYADGREDLYLHVGDGQYASPAGQFEKSVTLVAGNADNIIVRHLQDGTVETYRDTPSPMEHFLLESVEHATLDNKIELFYDGSNENRLTRIRDTRGRDFKFAYDGNARVLAIQDWSGGGGSADRAWTLGYDGSGNLTSCTLPYAGAARVFEFGYDGSSRLTMVTAPREADSNTSGHLEMWYDAASSKVTKQRFGASGAEYILAHDTSAKTMLEVDREGTSRIYFYDDYLAVTRIRVDAGASHDTDYGWDAGAGLLTKVVLPEGNGIRYVYDGGRLVTMAQCTAAGLSGTISRGSADFLVTSYGYASSANWTLVNEVTDPKGNAWTMARDSDGNVEAYATPEHPNDPWTFAYDGRGRVAASADPEGRATEYAYGATGTLTMVARDPAYLNLETKWFRDIYENVVTARTPDGEDTVYARNVLGYATKVTTPEGHETDYFYDLNDLVTQILSDNNNPDMPNSRHKVAVAYNILDIPTEVREYYGSSHGSSRVWSYAYDKEDRLTLTTLPVSTRKIKSVYDARGLETTRIRAWDTAAATAAYSVYDKNGRLTKTKDGNLNETAYLYDSFDRLTRVTDAEGHYRTTGYDANGNATLLRAYRSDDAKLAETALAYDDANLLASRTEWAKKADLSTDIGTGAIASTLQYDKSGLLITKADPCGCGGSGTTVRVYDDAGRLATVKDHNPATYQARVLMDENGRTTKVEHDEIDGGTTRTYVVARAYDRDGNLTKAEEKGGGAATALTTTLLVDAKGRVRKTTDPNGGETFLRRDDFGRVVQTDRMLTMSTHIETRVVYDLNDNILQRILERGATDGVLEYVYDEADRLSISKDEGAADHESHSYDAAGNVAEFTDRNGSVVEFHYDALNRMTLQEAALAGGVAGPTETKWYYDALGRAVSAFNGDAKVQRTFNTLSKLESETVWVNPVAEGSPGISSKTVSYTYDGDGHLSLIHYPDGETVVRRSYDTPGRVTRIEKKRGGGSYSDVATWTFQGPSKMKTLEWGNNTRETMAYDVYGRATSMTHERQTGSTTWVDMYDYERGCDAGGRPVFERREYRKSSDGALLTGPRDFGSLYSYDAADRLATVVRGVGYQTASHGAAATAALATIDFHERAEYAFDVAGNRLAQLLWDSDGTVSKQIERHDHTFDIENQPTTRLEWFYDGSSGLTLRNTIEYEHDANGAVVSTSGGGIGAVSVDLAGRIYERGDWVYRYDPFGRRVEKRNTAGGYHRWFYYDGHTCIEEYQVCDLHGEPDECGFEDPVWQRIYGPYLVDQILWGEYDADGDRGTSNDAFFFHLDFTGSVAMLTEDTSGYPSILETYRYDEYGNVAFFDGDGGALTASAFNQDKLYTGRRLDTESGLYHYRARTMDASSGAFLSRDPVWTWGSLYSYVGNRPIDRIDPMGKQVDEIVVLDGTMRRFIESSMRAEAEAEEARKEAEEARRKKCQDQWRDKFMGDVSGPVPPWVPFFWPDGKCGPCPPVDPGSSVGDGWCREVDISSHPGAFRCYRSYGQTSTCGQQCCYDKNGNLIEDGSAAQGTIDFVGPSTGEDSSGECTGEVLLIIGHLFRDWAEWKFDKPRYQAIQDCMRAAGIPTGSASGSPVTDSKLSATYDACARSVDNQARKKRIEAISERSRRNGGVK